MKSGRLFLATLLTILLGGVFAPAVSAESDETGAGKSGLDFSQGYDVNTVATISGRVVALPELTGLAGRGHAVIVIQSKDERVNLVVGPGQFWEKQGMAVSVGDEVKVRGAMAQGRDGNTYMFTQQIECRGTGSAITLRNESGAPVWMDRNPAMMTDRMRNRGGDMRMRDRGGMMRGERGMMRR